MRLCLRRAIKKLGEAHSEFGEPHSDLRDIVSLQGSLGKSFRHLEPQLSHM